MHPALFYRPGIRLTLPELTAARLDGHVVEVGEGYMPADTVEGPDARATGIAELVPPRTAACGPSAAWVHGAGDRPPAVHHVRRTSAVRLRTPPSGRVVHHDVLLPPEDVTTIGGIAVATLDACALELALAAPRHPEHVPWLRAVLALSPGVAETVRARIAAHRKHPGRRAALTLLDEVTAGAGIRTW
ncbi:MULTISPECIES: hypothetical protein [Microbacterium]|uniref:hypothetical protein n=1 Tax=Microbacterium TaxID=33882 RepID=UPI00217DBEF9|nr:MULTISPECIES: hypothetical protein [Microbacterium]UWF76525.1 hypothetical protein JSY13_06370 [Microbacterium neungamense]WCM54677.1 hypothetical protein JRG78_06400 [Microbacterium sp. EF45047]